MIEILYNLVLFIISLSILVAIHEGGHFFAARLCGVKVLRFSIGFGKVLLKKTAKDGCEYAISAIPLGGYVKMLGEEDDKVADSDLDKCFSHKSKLQRAFIIIAGPLANIILALLLYICVFAQGESIVRPIVAHVSPQSLAMQAQFKVDDEIIAVDDKDIRSLNEFLLALVDNAGNKVSVTVKNINTQKINRTLSLDLSNLEIKPGLDVFSYIGLNPKTVILSNTIAYVKEDSSAFRAGLKVGDIIVGIDDLKTDNFYEVQDYIKMYGNKTITIHFLRDGKLMHISLLPNVIYNKALEQDTYQIGIAPSVKPYGDLIQKIDYTFTQAIARAATQTYDMGLLIIRSVGKMISGSISYENLSGPITIAKGASQSVELGLTYYLGFLALISVNLGILNLFPIPVLDGGQLVFITYEAIAKKKANEKMQVFLSMLGMALLFILTFFAIFNDFRTL